MGLIRNRLTRAHTPCMQVQNRAVFMRKITDDEISRRHFSWQLIRIDNPLTFGRLVDLEHAICNTYSYTMDCPPVWIILRTGGQTWYKYTMLHITR